MLCRLTTIQLRTKTYGLAKWHEYRVTDIVQNRCHKLCEADCDVKQPLSETSHLPSAHTLDSKLLDNT